VVLWVRRGKTAEAVRCQQMPFGRGKNAFRLFTRQHAVKEANCENLVGPYGLVATIAVDYVVETSCRFVPELLTKTLTHATSKLLVVRAGDVVPKTPRQVLHNPERVVPECFNLDGFSMPRRDHPIAYLRVHPSELNSRLTGQEQALVVQTDAVTCAALMPRDDVGQYRVQLRADEIVVFCMFRKCADRFKEPKRSVHRVVFGR